MPHNHGNLPVCGKSYLYAQKAEGDAVHMGLTWSDAPFAAVYSKPYVFSLMPSPIEVRSAQHISQQGLAQVTFCCLRTCMLLATDLGSWSCRHQQAYSDCFWRKLSLRLARCHGCMHQLQPPLHAGDTCEGHESRLAQRGPFRRSVCGVWQWRGRHRAPGAPALRAAGGGPRGQE